MVTIRCPDHHRRLTNGLWSLYQTKDGRDSELTCGGQSIKAHGMVMQLFLSTNNFVPVKKASAVNMLIGGVCMEKCTPSSQCDDDERIGPVTKKRKLAVPDRTSNDANGSEISRTTANEFSRPGPLFEDGTTHEAINSDSSALTYRCSKCRAVFSSEAGMLAHVKKFRSTKKCDNLLELILEFLYKGSVTLSPERLDDLQAAARQLDFQLLADAVEETKRCKPLNVVIPRVEHMLDTSSDGLSSAKNKCWSKSTPRNVRHWRNLLTEKANSSQTDVCEDNENGDDQPCSLDFSVCDPDVPGGESDHSDSSWTPSKLQKLDVLVQQKQPPEIVSEEELKNQQQDEGKPRTSISHRFFRRSAKFAAVSEKFICPHCDYKTGVKYLYQKHFATHKLNESIMYSCPKCDFKSTFYCNIVRHHGSAHSVDMEGNPLPVLKCTLCEYTTVAKYNLSNHMKYRHLLETNTNNNAPPHKCCLCQFTTPYLNSLIDHRGSVHSVDLEGNPPPILKCKMCEYTAISRSNLYRHNRKSHSEFRPKRNHVLKNPAKLNPEEPHATKCKICNQEFESDVSLEEHMTEHPMRKCTICEYESRSSLDRKRHKKSSHPSVGENELIFVLICPYCDYLTKFSVALSGHMVKHHADKMTEEYLSTHQFCPLCRRLFKSVDDLEKHIASHETYKCNLCDYETKKRWQLPDHRKSVHSVNASGKPMIVHNCSECNFSANGAAVLKRHKLALHSGLKPYKCPYCDYATAWSTQVNRHIKFIHLDMKNHACNICDFRGVCQAELKNHMNVHSGQNSYKCNSCEKSFLMKRTLIRHQKEHTTPRSHICHLCGRAFKRNGNLITHMKHVHKNDAIE